MTNFGEIRLIKISDLLLDPKNPRLPEEKRGQSQRELAIELEIAFQAYEVAESIANHGFFHSDVLVGIPADSEGKFIVVEGNRRLTALLGLIDKDIRSGFWESRRWDELAVKNTLTYASEIPVVIESDRNAVVPMLSFRHIKGIRAWTAFAQANYIADQIEHRGLSTQEVADLTGLGKSKVSESYRELRIARQAKKLGIETGGMENSFSLLTVAMSNSKLREFVGAPLASQLPAEGDPIPPDHVENLKEVLGYIFGTETEDPKITDSRQIATLANVVANPAALTVLRTPNKSLEEAKQQLQNEGLNPSEKFGRFLNTAKNALLAAVNELPNIEGFEQNLTTLDEIYSAVESIKVSVSD